MANYRMRFVGGLEPFHVIGIKLDLQSFHCFFDMLDFRNAYDWRGYTFIE